MPPGKGRIFSQIAGEGPYRREPVFSQAPPCGKRQRCRERDDAS